jgi:hypothetical protein
LILDDSFSIADARRTQYIQELLMWRFENKYFEYLTKKRVEQELVHNCFIASKNLIEYNMAVVLFNLDCVTQDGLQPLFGNIQLDDGIVADHLKNE